MLRWHFEVGLHKCHVQCVQDPECPSFASIPQAPVRADATSSNTDMQ